MKSFSYQTPGLTSAEILDKISGTNSDVIFVFGNESALSPCGNKWEILRSIRKNSGCKHLIGCSTAGEIGRHVTDNGVSVLGLDFDETDVKVAHTKVDSISSSYESGRNLALSLLAENLAGIFILGPGVNINGSMVVKGLRDILPANVSVSGGLAGDGTAFQKTSTFLDDQIYDNELVAIGFYGNKIKITTAAAGGWKPFGPHRRVTKSEGSTLFTLDGRPALELYRDYLGDKAANLPSSGLLYPFSIISNENEDATGLIRTILNIDNNKNSLIFAGDIGEGELVTLAHANTEGLAEGAGRAATDALGDSIPGTGAALCVSCVGRKILMAQDTEEELESVQDVFGKIPVAGFYSYGEICQFESSGQIELHNQTMTITHIDEM